MSKEDLGYEGVYIRTPSVPEPELIGGWWRRRWSVELRGVLVRDSAVVPPPLGDAGMEMFVATWWISDTRLAIDTCTRSRGLTGPELTQISSIFAWLKIRFEPAQVVVEGMLNHPILHLNTLSVETIAELRGRGY